VIDCEESFLNNGGHLELEATAMDNPIGAIIGILIGLVVLYFVVLYIIIPGLLVLISVGTLWGGGHALVNYGGALGANVRLERPWIP
jgi:hypothetical protein